MYLRMQIERLRRGESGQAAVELLAALPVVLVVGMAAWQFAVAGHAWWRLNESARIAARAVYVADQRGEEAEGRANARRAAAALLGREARVSVDGGEVRVRTRIPVVWPFTAVAEDTAPTISAESSFGG